MKKEKIEELYGEHVTELTDAYDRYGDVYEYWSMRFEDFTNAINQAELEWYKKLHTKLNTIFSQPTAKGVERELSKYIIEIEEKIKELK